MDFLDPRTKKSRHRRLIASYLVMAALVAFSAFVLLYSSLGYGINTKTGQIIQNGLVFIDSKPLSADISVNGNAIGQNTSARLVLQSGRYELSLSRPGYRIWQTNIKISPQDVWRFSYPVLLPQKLSAKPVLSEKSAVFTSQSSDRHWILLGSETAKGLAIKQFDVTNPSADASALALPPGLLGFTGGQWQPLSWSGSSLLLSHKNKHQAEFVVIDRGKPNQSINLTTASKLAVSTASFKPGSSTELYMLLTNGRLVSFDLSSKKVINLLPSVSSYATAGGHIFYTTATKAPAGQLLAMLWDGVKSYQLAAISQSAVIAATAYQGNELYSLNQGGIIDIYQNPIPALKNGSAPARLARLHTSGSGQLKFSPDSHALVGGGGQAFASYDFSANRSKAFSVTQKLAGPLQWIDSYHLGSTASNGAAIMMDYQGDNQQLTLASSLSGGEFLSTDYKSIYTETFSGTTAYLNSVSLLLKN